MKISKVETVVFKVDGAEFNNLCLAVDKGIDSIINRMIAIQRNTYMSDDQLYNFINELTELRDSWKALK